MCLKKTVNILIHIPYTLVLLREKIDPILVVLIILICNDDDYNNNNYCPYILENPCSDTRHTKYIVKRNKDWRYQILFILRDVTVGIMQFPI